MQDRRQAGLRTIPQGLDRDVWPEHVIFTCTAYTSPKSWKDRADSHSLDDHPDYVMITSNPIMNMGSFSAEGFDAVRGAIRKDIRSMQGNDGTSDQRGTN